MRQRDEFRNMFEAKEVECRQLRSQLASSDSPVVVHQLGPNEGLVRDTEENKDALIDELMESVRNLSNFRSIISSNKAADADRQQAVDDAMERQKQN